MKFGFKKPKATTEDSSAAKEVLPKKEKSPKIKISFKWPLKKNHDLEKDSTPVVPKEKQEKTQKPEKKTKAEKKQKAPKSQLLSIKKPVFPRKARFTLLIGDEGAILLHMKGSKVLSRQFVPDASEGNLSELAETIEKDRLAPITMIIDSVDQVFVQQTLPPVSSLSVQKLINRRLERDFKPADIKGALVLGREKSGRKDWNFLMVSVEKSPQIMLWLDFVMRFDNRFRGIVLLSVEAEIFIKNLERAMGTATKAAAGAEWKILVSHNKVGGFRQIILRNGRLIFTRLALPVGEPTPDVVAGNIEQEMLSTIEYLKRFGYDPRTGLNIYIIASEEVCKRIEPRRFDAANFHSLPPNTVAQTLGIEGATQSADQFGDVVLAAAVGSISKNILKLTTVESRFFDRFQLLKIAQRLLVTFTTLGMIVYGAYLGYEALLASSEIEDYQQKQRLNKQSLELVKQKITDSKMDIDMVMDQLELYQQVKSEARSPITFLSTLQGAIPSPVILKSVSWKLSNTAVIKPEPSFVNFNLPGAKPVPGQPPDAAPPPVPPAGGAAGASDTITAILSLEFPAGLDSVPLFKSFADDFLKQLHTSLPDAMLAYTIVPGEYLPKEGLQLNFEQADVNPSKALGQKPIRVEVTLRTKVPIAGGVP